MKTDFWIVLATTLCPLLTHAQLPLPVKVGQPTIVDIGPHHRVWQTVTVDEQGQTNVSSYTELATGLNHVNPAGIWEESKEQFVITPEGYAVATNGQHQAILAPNINSGGSVDLITPEGNRFI